ncbi:MAG: T9SS type A sorting domain-containing protein [Flavobacteriales bacterium]|nr:T9SS type A sorting domain-containing protein [Flavobacteriales bacterium]MBK7482038.1 T9SS type A sorting domain-containing protein [Flavobacteriales bacterium]
MMKPYAAIATIILAGSLSAQVPNGGFESWSGNVPDNWSANNLAPLSFYVITPSPDARSGAFAARGEVLQNPIISSQVVSPTMQIVGGAPVTEDVPSISGWYKFSPTQGSTRLVVGANVLDVNGLVTGVGVGTYANAQSDYTAFTVAIDYSIGGNDPAAAVMISFIIADDVPAGAVGSWYLVDDLTLDGVASIKDRFLTDALVGTPYPSPFATRTVLPLSMTAASMVRADVVDLLGRPVGTLLNGNVSAGEHQLTWSPSAELANGVYFIRVSDTRGSIVRRVVLQR